MMVDLPTSSGGCWSSTTTRSTRGRVWRGGDSSSSSRPVPTRSKTRAGSLRGMARLIREVSAGLPCLTSATPCVRPASARASRSRTSRTSPRSAASTSRPLRRTTSRCFRAPRVVKGFLRTYAIFLKLDAEPLVEEYRSGYEPRTEEHPVLAHRHHPAAAHADQRRAQDRNGCGAPSGATSLRPSSPSSSWSSLAWFGSGGGRRRRPSTPSSITSSTSTTRLAVGSSTTMTDGSDHQRVRDHRDGSATSDHRAMDRSHHGRERHHGPDVTEGSCWLVVREDSESGAEVLRGHAVGRRPADLRQRQALLDAGRQSRGSQRHR